MSDFSQHGLISTLQNLNACQTGRLEAEVRALGRPTTLLLPCHAADLTRPSLANILDAVRESQIFTEAILCVNGGDATAFALAGSLLNRLPQAHRVLWTDGPALREVWERSPILARMPAGKGFNVWAGCGLIAAVCPESLIVTLDCDVISATREMLARLVYAALHPELSHAFGKVYYSRVTDRMHGRATRLLVAPLLQAVVRVAGHTPLLDFLQSFRYALSGECALRADLAQRLSMDAGWGLEIGMLCQVFREIDPRSACQVDGGEHYEHRHQPILAGPGGLGEMALEVCVTLFNEFAREGLVADSVFRRAVGERYELEAREALQRYRALSRINGLRYDLPAEEEAIAVFASAVRRSGEPGRERRLMPAWSRLQDELPDLPGALREAVEADNAALRAT